MTVIATRVAVAACFACADDGAARDEPARSLSVFVPASDVTLVSFRGYDSDEWS